MSLQSVLGHSSATYLCHPKNMCKLHLPVGSFFVDMPTHFWKRTGCRFSSLGAPGWQSSWSGVWKLSIEYDLAVRGRRNWSCSVSIPRRRLTSFVLPFGCVACGTGTLTSPTTRRSASSNSLICLTMVNEYIYIYIYWSTYLSFYLSIYLSTYTCIYVKINLNKEISLYIYIDKTYFNIQNNIYII